MSHAQAIKILALVRENSRDYPVEVINQALYLVGEITEEEYAQTL